MREEHLQSIILTPIVEISIDDINVLLSFLGYRFAEHKTLIFNITNCSYKDLNNSTSDNVKFEKLELVGKKLKIVFNSFSGKKLIRNTQFLAKVVVGEKEKKKAPLEQNWCSDSLSDEFSGPIKTFPARF